MHFVTLIAITAVLAFLAFIVALVIYRASLATISIAFDESPKDPGAEFEVAVAVQAKKSFSWDSVTLTLQCVDRYERHESVSRVIVYAQEIQLASASSMDPGETRHYQARLAVPETISPIRPGYALPDAFQEVFGSTITEALSRRKKEISWELVVKVARDGVHLENSERVLINLMP
jgi:hypothetical protein